MSTPRFMICGTNSGCGKTMITCGILKALCERGLRTAAFKCGPDYIDPMFHSTVIGAKSRNVDTFFADPNTARWLMQKNAKDADISVVEGVMGYYDGIADTDLASTYEVSKVTETPAVLVINAAGTSVSAAASAKGFLEFRSDNRIRGIILNRVSRGLYPRLKALIERECGVKVYGYLPKNTACAVESRHLGLVKPEEIEDMQERLSKLAGIIEETIDLDGLLALGETAPALSCTEPETPRNGKGLRIAVARDDAFCFYYEDNIMLLKEAGCEIVPFSPLTDEALPEADGLLLGGGYPELYADALAANKPMLASIRKAAAEGMPCIAECGGFMYLHKTLRTAENADFSLAGVIDGEVAYTGKLGRFGYIELTTDCESLFGKSGTKIRGHEFHYYDSTDTGRAFTAEKPVSNRTWQCVHADDHLICGFPHYYFYSNPQAAAGFLDACRKAERS